MDAARAAQMAVEPGNESVGVTRVGAAENGLPDASGLTAREQEVAALIAQGKTSKEIADALVITERTADTHAAHIREKLGLRSRAEIAAWATRLGLGVQRHPRSSDVSHS
jgi:DNA-binding CsgD family transcriptional regulator